MTLSEASIGYTGAAAVAVMDEVAFVNERQDKRMVSGNWTCRKYVFL